MVEIDLGYHIHRQILDASCLVPQKIKKLYIVGFKEDKPFTFPTFTNPNPKLEDILEYETDPKFTLRQAMEKNQATTRGWNKAKDHSTQNPSISNRNSKRSFNKTP